MPQSPSPASSPRISALLRTTVLAGFSLAVLPSITFAQQANNDETVTKPLEVTASAKSAQGLPGGVSIGQEELDRKNPQTMKDVFSSDASVEVGGPTAIVQKVYVQGIENTKLNVQVDGARQVDSSFHHIGT
ncbi:MAG: TonB-dependent receptor plug domain-containing protein, partial [Thalassospira sp.]|nr:TonB-dependent receptor plug domain-containing protein [Thalassospira sp.]